MNGTNEWNCTLLDSSSDKYIFLMKCLLRCLYLHFLGTTNCKAREFGKSVDKNQSYEQIYAIQERPKKKLLFSKFLCKYFFHNLTRNSGDCAVLRTSKSSVHRHSKLTPFNRCLIPYLNCMISESILFPPSS
jgi:hypothetical protein